MDKNDSEFRHQFRDMKRAGREMRMQIRDSMECARTRKGFKWIKERIIRDKNKSSVNFPVHLTVFAAVNAFLMALNFTIAGPYPWFYFVLGGWGIGLLSHLQSLLNKRREAGELAKIENMPDKPFRIFRRLQKSISSFRHHVMAYVTVNAYICGINLLVSPHFLWCLFSVGPWFAGLLAHWVAHNARKKILKAELKNLGVDIKVLKRQGITLPLHTEDDYQNLFSKAVALKENILKEIGADPSLKNQWGEMEPVLNKYTEQIKDLMQKSAELDKILASYSLLDIEEEIGELKKKQAQAESMQVKKEYERSIAQFERHRNSIQEVSNQKEIIALRLSTAIALLNQIQLDTVRMKHVHDSGEHYSFKELQNKTAEIQEYLSHFQEEIDKLEQV